MRAGLWTAGERVELSSSHGWVSRVLSEGTAGQPTTDADSPADIHVCVEASSEAFDTRGWGVLTREAWHRPGQVVVRNACSSGLDVMVTAATPTLQVVARWRPPVTGRAAAAVLQARSRLLIRAVLLQYPALWWAQQRGRPPLHASVCTIGGANGRTVLIAGPGGVGKSTLVNTELARGGRATTDNVCVSDGRTAWGVLEPRRVPAGEAGSSGGRRMPHGRKEAPWPNRVPALVPDLLLVLRRGHTKATSVTGCAAEDAAAALAAGTYMAGELRRYWAFAATLALGTGIGQPHPPIEAMSMRISGQLPCLQVDLGERPTPPLAGLLENAMPADVGT